MLVFTSMYIIRIDVQNRKFRFESLIDPKSVFYIHPLSHLTGQFDRHPKKNYLKLNAKEFTNHTIFSKQTRRPRRWLV